MTPYILVDAEADGVHVPKQYVENGKIVLNVGPRAVDSLDITNDAVLFSARFAGTPFNVEFPVEASLAIYARENGQGMVFNEEEGDTPPDPEPDKPPRPNLKIVK